jgi:surface protein
MNKLLNKLNSKMIFSSYSDSLVYFVEDLDSISEDDFIKLGHYAVSDGITMIDFKDNTQDDISNMYGVKSWSPREFSNLADFYSEINFYDDKVNEEQIISFFDVFLDRDIYDNPRIFIDSNGVTIKCENCFPGYKGLIDGIEYEVVDDFLIYERIAKMMSGDGDIDLRKLCTTLVTDMSYLFSESEFNQSIESWDVSNVLDMSGMFKNSKFNQPIENWDVSKVINMEGMFAGSAFNQPIGKWDVSNVIDMSYMFLESKFKQSIENWKINKSVDIDSMF